MRRLLVLGLAFGVGCASRSSLDLTPRGGDAGVDGSVLEGGRLDDASRGEDGGADGSADASGLDAPGADVPTFETWSVAAEGGACTSRPPACSNGDDFGASIAVADVYTRCVARVGAACGDLVLAFDAEGCLAEAREIRGYSAAFVACVVELASGMRWGCALAKGLHMLQACP